MPLHNRRGSQHGVILGDSATVKNRRPLFARSLGLANELLVSEEQAVRTQPRHQLVGTAALACGSARCAYRG
jgi:hypothetical protein